MDDTNRPQAPDENTLKKRFGIEEAILRAQKAAVNEIIDATSQMISMSEEPEALHCIKRRSRLMAGVTRRDTVFWNLFLDAVRRYPKTFRAAIENYYEDLEADDSAEAGIKLAFGAVGLLREVYKDRKDSELKNLFQLWHGAKDEVEQRLDSASDEVLKEGLLGRLKAMAEYSAKHKELSRTVKDGKEVTMEGAAACQVGMCSAERELREIGETRQLL